MLADIGSKDLLALSEGLVRIPSVSQDENEIADQVTHYLSTRTELEILRFDNAVVARGPGSGKRRVVFGGHLDTVPGSEPVRLDGDVLVGLGSADMKSGLAVMLRLAEETDDHLFDSTFVFYDGEEIADEFNGLRRIFDRDLSALRGDFAIVLEPTAGAVEAGCQGVVVARAEFAGARAHAARPWTGDNAIHKMAAILSSVARTEVRTVEVDGLEFMESLQVVKADGGIANNVVPDEAGFVLSYRFAPNLSEQEAVNKVMRWLDGADRIEVLTTSPPASPNLKDPLVAEFCGSLDLMVKPKLGWTDVARFSAAGIPAINFGPGDPLLAHTSEESVTREAVEGCYGVLSAFMSGLSS